MLDHRSRSQTPVFQNIRVSAFRGLKDVQLTNVGRLNILVGMNNSGKTSVLEAIAVLCSGVDPVSWSSTARLRDHRAIGPYDPLSGIDAVRWLFPHSGAPADALDQDEDRGITDSHLPLSLGCDGRGGLAGLEATCTRIRGILPEDARPASFYRRSSGAEEGLPIEDEGWLLTIDPVYRDGALGPARIEYPLWSSIGFRRSGRSIAPDVRFEFLSPYAHRNQPGNLRRLTSSVVEGRSEDVVGMLNKLDPDILDLQILTTADGRRPVLAVRHRKSGLIPASVLGDGARRALSIALAVRGARDGVLLIDELEAALHVSALDVVFPWLCEACRDMNVQLFATTHSLEAVDAISARSNAEGHDIVAFRLDDEHPDKRPNRYDFDMLNRLVHERGLDIR